MARYGMVIDATTCVGCEACVAACSMENQTPYWRDRFRTHIEEHVTGSYPNVQRQFIPRLCMHCENTPCLLVCPTGATYKTEEGIVKVDQSRCIGCGYCMIACPYDARYPYERGYIKEAKEIYGTDIAHRMPHVDKCDFCEHRVKQGLQPACVETCPLHARIFGDLDDSTSEVAKLVISGKAKPLHANLGTRPKVFYLGFQEGGE
jgi:Fe-S-cluster-containing dehydrogenase component